MARDLVVGAVHGDESHVVDVDHAAFLQVLDLAIRRAANVTGMSVVVLVVCACLLRLPRMGQSDSTSQPPEAPSTQAVSAIAKTKILSRFMD